mgnify:CR=1 FL=1
MTALADIVMADDGISFDGNSLQRGPLGGAETAFVSLATSLAKRGNNVSVINNCPRPMKKDGVNWAPIRNGIPERCDLFIANRSDKLLPLAAQARTVIFWIHNPAKYLLKFRYLSKIWRRKPIIIFSGSYHAKSYPKWAPDGGRKIIPYGISDDFDNVHQQDAAPKPVAIFTSNPLRGLSWLLDLWSEHISTKMPDAELHIYSGPLTYGELGSSQKDRMQLVLDKALELSSNNVHLHNPVPKKRLVEVLKQSRVLLYRGDPGETFCLAVGEAQAAGVPAVVQDIGCVAERVIDGKTGFVAKDDVEFADAALKLLKNDNLWLQNHVEALNVQGSWGWNEAAAEFERLIK